MTTWTDIPDEVLEPGKPIRSVDILALRDNPIAIAGGAAGAPRIVTNAINNSAVTTAKIADANVTTAKLATNERMTTANVLSATAGASVGAVGSYAFCWTNNSQTPGSTRAGSLLRFTSADANPINTAPAGTWRMMGQTNTNTGTSRASLWLRIS